MSIECAEKGEAMLRDSDRPIAGCGKLRRWVVSALLFFRAFVEEKSLKRHIAGNSDFEKLEGIA